MGNEYLPSAGTTLVSNHPKQRQANSFSYPIRLAHSLPILECTRDVFIPLEKNGTMEWGYRIPYMLTGQLNMHPRAAITMRAGDAPDDYAAFYDQLVEEE